jgi:hypothetical protein
MSRGNRYSILLFRFRAFKEILPRRKVLNKLQCHNQRLLALALRKPLLISCIEVRGRIIDVTTSSWQEYWEDCDSLSKELVRLYEA